MTTSLPSARPVIAAAKPAPPLPTTTISCSSSQACWAKARDARKGTAPTIPVARAAPAPPAFRNPRRETRSRASRVDSTTEIPPDRAASIGRWRTKRLLSQAGIVENVKILRLVTHFRKAILDDVPRDVVQMGVAAETRG